LNGKDIRINRITKNGRMLCVPMDHGISIGPVSGLNNISETINQVDIGGASAILTHKGIIKSLTTPPNTGVIIHLSASTDIGLSPNRKLQVCSVEEAIRLGADAVSVHVNIGGKEESEMLVKLGNVADQCDEWQIPFIAMMYPRGENIKNPRDGQIAAHVARIGSELGADIVKTPYTGNIDEFREVVKGCTSPIVIAGGPKTDNDAEILQMAKDAIESGAIGVTFGRNVFQHKNPQKIIKALSKVVLDDLSVNEGLAVIKNE